MDKDITDLLDAESSHIKKLQAIVRQTIEDENLIIQNLNLFLQEQIKVLFESQAKQMELLKSINAKL